jgi:hypothetical protein
MILTPMFTSNAQIDQIWQQENSLEKSREICACGDFKALCSKNCRAVRCFVCKQNPCICRRQLKCSECIADAMPGEDYICPDCLDKLLRKPLGPCRCPKDCCCPLGCSCNKCLRTGCHE